MQTENYKGDVIESKGFENSDDAIEAMKHQMENAENETNPLKVPAKITFGNFRIGEPVIVNGLKFKVQKMDAHKKRLTLKML